MKFTDIITTANKNLLRNKARTFLTIFAIFIGSFSIITTVAMNQGVNNFVDEQVEAYGGDGMLQITATNLESLTSTMIPGMTAGEPPEYGAEGTEIKPITDAQIEQVKQLPGIKADSIQISRQINVNYATGGNSSKKYVLQYDIVPPGEIHIAATAGTNISNASPEYQLILPHSYVGYFGFTSDQAAVGQKLNLHIIDQVTGADKIVQGTIVGVQAPGIITQNMVYVNSALSDAIFNTNVESLPASYRAEAEKKYAIGVEYDYKNYTAKEIKQELSKIGLSALTVDDLVGKIRGFFDAITVVFTVFGTIALITASIGIVNTLLMSVQERTREIGLDKALGESSSRIFLSFSLEAAALGFWGSALGTVVSIFAGKALNHYLHRPGQILADLPTFHLLSYSATNIIMVIVIIMAIAFIAGTLPALKAAKKNPIDALRYE